VPLSHRSFTIWRSAWVSAARQWREIAESRLIGLTQQPFGRFPGAADGQGDLMKFRRISGRESLRFSSVMKALSRYRLAIACTLIAVCFVIGAEPRKAAALIRKHQSFFPNLAVGKLYDMFAAGTGLVRVQDPPQPTRKPGWRGSDDPPVSADAAAQSPPQQFITHAPAVGSDSCPGTSITSLPFSDSDTTSGANNTVSAIPGGCSTYMTVAGPDKIYTFNVVTAGSLTVTATPSGGTYDLAAYLISSCPGGTGNTIGSGCIMGADVVNTNTVETFTVANLAPGTYYLYIDSFYSTGGKSSGPYSLSVTGTAILGAGCTLTCPANVTTANDTNQCGAVVNYPSPTTSGECGTVNCSPPSGSFFPVGTTTVNCASSAEPSCSFTVTVNDTQAPTMTCPANVTQGTDSNQCGAVVNFPLPTGSDNCPGVTTGCSPPSGSFFPVGTTTVNCTASDASPNSPNATCSFTVTINDTQPPVVTCPANVTQGNDPNQCGAVVNYPAPSVTDNCPGATADCSPPAGSFFTVGTTTVTCTASAGPSCSFTVTVQDTQPPVITCPANVTVPNDPDQCGAVVTYPNATATDNCDSKPAGPLVNAPAQVAANCSPASGSFFPVGTTTVTCTASDDSPNSPDSTCTFVVTVTNAAPVLTYGSPQTAQVGQTTNINPATGPTDTNLDIISVLSINPPLGASISVNNATGVVTVGSTSQAGTYVVTIRATDKCGVGTNATFTLQVVCPGISVDPVALPGGVVGASYSQTLAGSPPGPYSYSVTSGALPLGLSLNASTGLISGTPTTTGSYSFRVAATIDNCSGFRDYTVTIACSSITLTPATLPAGQAGIPYSQTINVSPSGSYTYSIATGNLPAGLTLYPTTGVISGTPATTGADTFTIKVQAYSDCFVTQSYTLVVGCPVVTINPATVPNGTIGTAYNQQLTATPVGGNYTFTITSGALPNGLNLNPATGILSGSPTANGSSTFTVTARGWGRANCTGSQAYTIVVGSGTSCPTVTLPGSLPSGSVGQLYSNSVAASPSGAYTYTSTGSLPTGVTLYQNGLLFGYPTANGSYTFTVTATDANNCTASQAYTVQIGAGSVTALNDFSGDRKSDFVLWRPAQAQWLIVDSATSASQTALWGSAGDKALAGDYDGDGKADFAAFGQDGHWRIRLSGDGSALDKVWGSGSDIPVPGDYDGDGNTDLAVWRGAESAWHIQRSSDGQTQTEHWGAAHSPYFDVAVPGDYDGDGRTDVAVFRTSTGHWYIKRSSDGAVMDKAWGLGTDVPVPGDYDGDGQTDIAIWRGSEGAWYIIRSADSAIESKVWGISEAPYFDVPALGDYDGDGKADVAVWRKSEGRWYVRQSSDGATRVVTQGRTGDQPVTAAPRP
jgi:hypothetical protein